LFYRESTSQWVIENDIVVEDIGDFLFRVPFDYKPNVETVLQEKYKTMQEVYIQYMLKGE
jgi:hypothetical protein